MNIHRLRSFAVVAELGSVRAAARALGYTPAAISQHLTVLADEAGAAVVEREGRGVRVTDFGRALLHESAPLLGAQDRLEVWLAGEGRRRRTHLRLGYFGSAGRRWVPPLIDALRHQQAARSFELLLTERDLATAEAVDLNIYVAGPTPLVQLGHDRHLTAEEYAVAVPVDHPLAGRRVPLNRLADEAWIDNDNRSGTCRKIFLDACARAGFAPAFTVQTEDYDTALAFVDAGIGVTAIPAAAIPAHHAVIHIADPAPTRRIRIAWRRDSEPAAAAVKILERMVSEGGA